MAKYRRIGLTVKSGFDHKDEAIARILKILRSLQCTVAVDPTRIHDLPSAREIGRAHV